MLISLFDCNLYRCLVGKSLFYSPNKISTRFTTPKNLSWCSVLLIEVSVFSVHVEFEAQFLYDNS
jgi:hypothetical protein